MARPVISLDSEFLAARLELMEARTDTLSEDFDHIMSRVSHLQTQQQHRCELAEHEKQLMEVIELFMQDDVRAGTVMDYVIVFFRLVLVKMRQRGHDFDDVKQLHTALSDDDTAQTFRTVLSKLAFPPTEQKAVKIILEVLQHRPWPASEVMTTSPGGDAQISSALLYIRLQRDLDPATSACLQRALRTAHECVLRDIAVSETFCDVNINASDVRRDDAYVDGRVKYGTHTDFDTKTDSDDSDETLNCETVMVKNSTVVETHRGGGINERSIVSEIPERKRNPRRTHRPIFEKSELDDAYTQLTESHTVSFKTSCDTQETPDEKADDLADDSESDSSSSDQNDQICSAADEIFPTLDNKKFAPDTKLYAIYFEENVPAEENVHIDDERADDICEN